MDRLAKQWYRMKCQLALHQKTGNEFQDFFSRVMEMRHGPDFTRVRPWGNLGDRKCDGYLISKKLLFQVYAPDEMTLKAAEDKIDADFGGALAFWGEHISAWGFVHNGRNGISGDLHKKLSDLGQNHPDQRLVQYGPNWLLDEVTELDLRHLEELFGPLPAPQMMQEVRANDIVELLRRIEAGRHDLPTELPIVPPDKMNFNDFSPAERSSLEWGRQKEKAVEDVMNQWPDPLHPDRVANGFRRRYKELKEQGLSADKIYFELTRFAKADEAQATTAYLASLALLSYLFFNCDIFESKPQ